MQLCRRCYRVYKRTGKVPVEYQPKDNKPEESMPTESLCINASDSMATYREIEYTGYMENAIRELEDGPQKLEE